MASDEKIYQIGVMIGNVHTQHPKELIQGIYEAAANENVNVTMLLAAQGNAMDFWQSSPYAGSTTYNYQFNALYDYSLIAKLDALIISYGTLCIYYEQEDREEFLKKFRKVPLIILEEYEERSQDSFIMSDNYGSMCNIVEHLIQDHKYKKILYLSGPKNNMDAKERRAAYMDSMASHDLPVTDDMWRYGDYSANVDYIVEELLDNNPDAEALVCANDEMAISAYRVCQKRGLVVGKDIAVTGYDDIELAQRMDPPLTTANQDGIDMGYRALKLAVQVCTNNIHKSIKLPARFKKRASCGCTYYTASDTNLMIESLKLIKNSADTSNMRAAASCAAMTSVISINSDDAINRCRKFYNDAIQMLYRTLGGEYTLQDSEMLIKDVLEDLRDLFDPGSIKQIDITKFTHTYHEIINYIVTLVTSNEINRLLYHLFETTETYIQSYIMHNHFEVTDYLHKKNWLLPAMIQKMMENVNDEYTFYSIAMEQLKDQGVNNAFLYLLKSPEKYTRDKEFKCPSKLYLATQCVNGKITAYSPDERPVITKTEGLTSTYPEISGRIYNAFILFTEEYQYGLLLCEISSDLIDDIFGLSLQISTAQTFLQLHKKEAATKKKLYDTLKTLEDKNKVLSFISANDQLTGLYNRRGFMEHVIDETRENEGSTAILFFSDLDHLKEINDVFGHSEGDYALLHAAEILQNTFRSIGFAGRLGGDEFVSMVVSNDQEITEKILKKLKQATAELNGISGKPYYIEFSTGYVRFTCSPETSISDMINAADEALYEAKQSRRKSIRRDQ